MSRRTTISEKSRIPDVSLGGVVRETLPFPVVSYPKHHGTFFDFSERQSGQSDLCECSRSAIYNLIRLNETSTEPGNPNARRGILRETWFFPDSTAATIKLSEVNVLSYIRFAPGHFHQCNLVSLFLGYCHEMYGTKFIKHFGWYLN
jgi:hypothetical protein